MSRIIVQETSNLMIKKSPESAISSDFMRVFEEEISELEKRRARFKEKIKNANRT